MTCRFLFDGLRSSSSVFEAGPGHYRATAWAITGPRPGPLPGHGLFPSGVPCKHHCGKESAKKNSVLKEDMTSLPSAPDAMRSRYRIGTVDPSIRLMSGRVTVAGQGTTLDLRKSKLSLELAAGKDLKLFASGPSQDPAHMTLAMSDWPADEFTYPRRARGRLVDIGSTLGGDFRRLPYKLNLEASVRDLRSDDHQSLDHVSFLLLNFPDFVGNWISDGGKRWRGRLSLAWGGWGVVIDSRGDHSEVDARLRTRGRYAVTHVGSLHKNGSTFPSVEAEELLTSLHWFFSLVRGSWCSPVIFDGYQGGSTIRWRKYESGRIDPGRGGFQWCDPTGWTAAQQAFVGYLNRWQDPVWQQALRVAIGLYVTANRTQSVEVSIIAAQSGLELLGWVHFVENGKIKPSDWRYRIKAEDKIRRLLKLAKVKPRIPSNRTSLRNLDPNWKDGPAVIAGVRNRLVHPRHAAGTASWPGDVLVDAWLLSSRYLELLLLHALGVTSPIRDRLGASQWVGSVSKPPWAPNDAPFS